MLKKKLKLFRFCQKISYWWPDGCLISEQHKKKNLPKFFKTKK